MVQLSSFFPHFFPIFSPFFPYFFPIFSTFCSYIHTYLLTGPLCRQLAYINILPFRSTWDGLLIDDATILERYSYLFIGNWLHKKMCNVFSIGNSIQEKDCVDKLKILFEKIENERLNNRKGKWRYIF